MRIWRVEDGARHDRLGEHPQNSLGRAVVKNDKTGQPRRHRQQEQWRNDEADQQVLQHVNEVQVLLSDVVHRPVGGEPYMATPTMKNRFWLTVVTGSPAGTASGPMFRTE